MGSVIGEILLAVCEKHRQNGTARISLCTVYHLALAWSTELADTTARRFLEMIVAGKYGERVKKLHSQGKLSTLGYANKK